MWASKVSTERLKVQSTGFGIPLEKNFLSKVCFEKYEEDKCMLNYSVSLKLCKNLIRQIAIFDFNTYKHVSIACLRILSIITTYMNAG